MGATCAKTKEKITSKKRNQKNNIIQLKQDQQFQLQIPENFFDDQIEEKQEQIIEKSTMYQMRKYMLQIYNDFSIYKQKIDNINQQFTQKQTQQNIENFRQIYQKPYQQGRGAITVPREQIEIQQIGSLNQISQNDIDYQNKFSHMTPQQLQNFHNFQLQKQKKSLKLQKTQKNVQFHNLNTQKSLKDSQSIPNQGKKINFSSETNIIQENEVQEINNSNKVTKQFQIELFEQDEGLKNILSFQTQTLIRQKKCQPSQYKSLLSFQMYNKDISDQLRQYVVFRMIAPPCTENKNTIRYQWQGENQNLKGQKVVINILYIQEDPKIVKYYEEEYNLERTMSQNLSKINSKNILKMHQSQFYKKQIFLESQEYIIIKIEESTSFTLQKAIRYRKQPQNEKELINENQSLQNQQLATSHTFKKQSSLLLNEQRMGNPYTENELFYLLEIFASALYQAKKQYIFHGNLHDENIIITQDNVYKIANFNFYSYNTFEKEIDVNTNHRLRIISKMTERRLMFQSPELRKFYEKWIKNYDENKYQERKKLKAEKKIIFEKLQQLKHQQQFLEVRSLVKTRKNDENQLKQQIDDLQNRLNELQSMDLEDNIDFFASDVYSLGIIMINLMTLGQHEEEIIDLYKQNQKINLTNILESLDTDSSLENEENFFYPNLIHIISGMVKPSPQDRLTYDQILQKIVAFSEKNKKDLSTFSPIDYKFYDLQQNPEEDSKNQKHYKEKIKQLQNNPLEQQRLLNLEKQKKQEETVKAFKFQYLKAKTLMDIQNYPEAEEILEKLLLQFKIQRNWTKQNITGISEFQVEFLKAVCLIEQRKLDQATISLNNITNELEEMIQKQEISQHYLKIYYYKALCSFLSGQNVPAINYLKRLMKDASELLINFENYSLNMYYQLLGNCYSDECNFEASIQCFEKITYQMQKQLNREQKEQEKQENFQKNQIINFHREEEINALYQLGYQNLIQGEYFKAEVYFLQVLKYIKERKNYNHHHVFLITKLITQGYLAEINFFQNKLSQIQKYILQCQDTILEIIKRESSYLDTLIFWLEKFSYLIEVHLKPQEFKQSILSVIENKIEIANSSSNKQLQYDNIYIKYTLGKAYFYAEDENKSVQHFLDALKYYNESSETIKMRENERKKIKSNYLIKINKYKQDIQKQKLQENQKEKENAINQLQLQKKILQDKIKLTQEEQLELKEIQQNIKELYQQRNEEKLINDYFIRKIDPVLISHVYDWLQYIYNQKDIHKKLKIKDSNTCQILQEDSIKNFITHYNQAIQESSDQKFNFLYRMGQIMFSKQEYLQALDFFDQATDLVDKKKKSQITQIQTLDYSRILIWKAIINSLLNQEKKATEAIKECQQVLEETNKHQIDQLNNFLNANADLQMDLQSQNSILLMITTFLDLGIVCIALGQFEKAYQNLQTGFQKFNEEQSSIKLDYLFLMGYTCTLMENIQLAAQYYQQCDQLCSNEQEKNRLDKKILKKLHLIKDYLGRSLLSQGKYAKAQQIFQQSYKIYLETSQKRDLDQNQILIFKIGNLVQTYYKMGKYELAIQFLDKIFIFFNNNQMITQIANLQKTQNFDNKENTIKSQNQNQNQNQLQPNQNTNKKKRQIKNIIVLKFLLKQAEIFLNIFEKVPKGLYSLLEFYENFLQFQPELDTDFTFLASIYKQFGLYNLESNLDIDFDPTEEVKVNRIERGFFFLDLSQQIFLEQGEQESYQEISYIIAYHMYKTNNYSQAQKLIYSLFEIKDPTSINLNEIQKKFLNQADFAKMLLLLTKIWFHDPNKSTISPKTSNLIKENLKFCHKIFQESYDARHPYLTECDYLLNYALPLKIQEINEATIEEFPKNLTKIEKILLNSLKNCKNPSKSPEILYIRFNIGLSRLLKSQYYRNIKWLFKNKDKNKQILSKFSHPFLKIKSDYSSHLENAQEEIQKINLKNLINPKNPSLHQQISSLNLNSPKKSSVLQAHRNSLLAQQLHRNSVLGSNLNFSNHFLQLNQKISLLDPKISQNSLDFRATLSSQFFEQISEKSNDYDLQIIKEKILFLANQQMSKNIVFQNQNNQEVVRIDQQTFERKIMIFNDLEPIVQDLKKNLYKILIESKGKEYQEIYKICIKKLNTTINQIITNNTNQASWQNLFNDIYTQMNLMLEKTNVQQIYEHYSENSLSEQEEDEEEQQEQQEENGDQQQKNKKKVKNSQKQNNIEEECDDEYYGNFSDTQQIIQHITEGLEEISIAYFQLLNWNYNQEVQEQYQNQTQQNQSFIQNSQNSNTIYNQSQNQIINQNQNQNQNQSYIFTSHMSKDSINDQSQFYSQNQQKQEKIIKYENNKKKTYWLHPYLKEMSEIQQEAEFFLELLKLFS